MSRSGGRLIFNPIWKIFMRSSFTTSCICNIRLREISTWKVYNNQSLSITLSSHNSNIIIILWNSKLQLVTSLHEFSNRSNNMCLLRHFLLCSYTYISLSIYRINQSSTIKYFIFKPKFFLREVQFSSLYLTSV